MKRSGFIIILLALSMASYLGCKRKGLDELVAEGKYARADSYCESIKDEQRAQCYTILATLYFREDKFDKAAFFYAKAGEHIKVIHSYFQGDLIPMAEEYARSQQGQVKRMCAAVLAKKFYLLGEKEKAITYYRLAGQHKMANYIEGMLPVFALYSSIKQSLGSIENLELRKKIAAYNVTLKTYIYMDDFLKWPYGNNSGVMKKAGELCQEALRIIDNEAAPDFMNELKKALSSGSWNLSHESALSLPHAKLDSLIKMVRYIHRIAKLKNFYSEHSAVYIEQTGSRDIALEESQRSRPKNAINYEQAFEKALSHGEGIFETIDFLSQKNDQRNLEEYIEDFAIDLQVMDYILTFMENLQTRIKDIQQRSKHYRDVKGGELEKKKADRILMEFVAAGNRSLYEASREEYQNANDRLTSAYESAKKDLKLD